MNKTRKAQLSVFKGAIIPLCVMLFALLVVPDRIVAQALKMGSPRSELMQAGPAWEWIQ